MKAIKYDQYGTQDVLYMTDIPIPEVGPDEILIKVAGTSFNPLDALIRMGYMKDFMPIEFPFTPNVDVSGTIVAIGSNVKDRNVGDEVFALLDATKDGGAAEYVITRPEIVVEAPKNIPLEEAGTIPLAGLTAWQSLFEFGNLKTDQKILIVGASGGVGSFAVQLAKWKGAHVTGTANIDNFDVLKTIGIDNVCEYSDDLTETINEKFDMVLNLTTLETDDVTKFLSLINPGGILVSTLNPVDDKVAENFGVKSIVMMHHQDVDQLNNITSIIESGKLKPLISEKVSLEKLANIHTKIGTTYGKVLLIP